MKKIIPFLIVLLVLFACKKELVKEPKSLIEREKMVDIMYDLSLLEAMRMENPILMDSFKNNSNQYVFKKYKIDSVQFAQSNIFYAANYKEYEKMYNQVKSRIDLKKKQIDSVKKSENMKKMLKEKAKEKLKLKKEADSIKKAKLKTTKEKDSLKKGQ
jgi:hypothetical protein